MAELWILLGLVVVNGVFSGAEIAVVALRRARIEELAERGHGAAKAVLALREEPERFLATVQVGITVISASAAAFGGASVAARLAPALEGLPGVGASAEALALALVVAGVSFLSIVIGELVPKSLALRSAERYALLVGRPLLALSWVARPLVWVLSASANLLLRPFGDRTTFTETRHSIEELQQIVEEATRAGTLAQGAGDIASRALDLPELTAADVMVPRQEVVMVARGAALEELERVMLAHPHSRMPVYDGGPDDIVGYLAAKDVLRKLLAKAPFTLDDVLRKPTFVPESMPALALLEDMRRRHAPFAIVVDESGGTEGIVTMEDLVEELVGDIFSEHTAHAPRLVERAQDGTFVVSGAAPVREVNRALDLELPEDGDWSTVAGLCLALAGRVPVTGDRFELPNGLALEVLDATPRRVRTLRVRVPPAPA